ETSEITYIDKNTRLEVPTENTSSGRVVQNPKVHSVPQARISPPLPPPPKLRVGARHEQFYRSLESMAAENPIVLMSHINKYAKSILNSDPETSIMLFKLSSDIKLSSNTKGK